MKTTLLAIIGVLVFSLGLSFLHAEDWTVNGKTYPNVKVTKVDPDKVHIMYDGGIGSVNLSDLPPDLQKRFNYDPKAAADAQKQAAEQQAQSDAMVAAATRANAISEQNAAAIDSISKHPLKMNAQIENVFAGSTVGYLVLASNNQRQVAATNGISSTGGTSTVFDMTPMVLNGQGGECVLVTSQTYTNSQSVSLTVYAAGTVKDERGTSYSVYSDDPATAAKLASK